MGTIKNITQKIKGKLEQIDGTVKQQSGNPVEGTLEKIKGKINDTVASAKLNNESDK